MEKPTATDFRTLPSLGVFGIFALVQLAQVNISLWRQHLFQGLFAFFIAMTAYGGFYFFKHWGFRAVAPAMVALVYILVAFSVSSYVTFAVIILTFIVVALAVSRLRPESNQDEQQRPANNSDLEYALKNAQQALRDALVQRDNAQLELAASTDKAHMLDTITPLIRAYNATHELLGELVIFAEDMEKVLPSGDFTADVEKVMLARKRNNEKFTDTYRLRLISLCTTLRIDHGVLNDDLVDVNLVRDVGLPLEIKPIIEGLCDAMNQLQKLLADAAGNLNV